MILGYQVLRQEFCQSRIPVGEDRFESPPQPQHKTYFFIVLAFPSSESSRLVPTTGIVPPKLQGLQSLVLMSGHSIAEGTDFLGLTWC